MSYILDTDTLIYFLKNQGNVAEHLLNTPIKKLHTTIINHSELLFGAFHSEHRKKNLGIVQALFEKITILPFSEQASYIFAENKAALKKTGKIIDDMDLMIASITLANRMTLVTNNTKHCNRIKNLTIENWI